MRITLLLLGMFGSAVSSHARVIRAFDDTTLAPGYAYGVKMAAPVVDPSFGAGQVARFTFSLNGQNSSAGYGFGFKDWGAYDFSSLTSISVYLKADTSRAVEFTFKMGTRSLYDTLGSEGKVFTAAVRASATGEKFTLTKANFDFPAWILASGVPTDPLVKTWLGVDSTTTYKNHIDTVLKDVKFIQIAIPCEKNAGGKAKNCVEDAGYLEIDSLVLNGASIGGGSWSDPVNYTGIRRHFVNHGGQFRAMVIGQNLDVNVPESATGIRLVRQDGSKVGAWPISGPNSRLPLPQGLVSGQYFVICDLPSGRQVGSVSILR